ncbi:DsbE family thiol:disulfide interchange protein [Roseovarius sp. LXJ103]|uniref:DsbE family thiol:disulfide interchange protein n=1 Tax=Roseovarius carneus TaxID=2853164 RepID=UPI000D60C64E|nr:DsbE family thiol:disulfide interchange protein [Roseovarius carneus]MBZ8118641.1 DsbE family thiol:disulfide interchange protein [Roseovarius carneus]PWE35674.1 DsbE family thiol:disulfide interchange protein [Pelagicola sp. LXJ1103]
MGKVSPLMMAPPLIFAGLAALFFYGMKYGDPNALPSVFIGEPAPPVPSEPLAGRVHLTDDMLRSGEVTVVNFWASWCPPCRAEHPYLLQMQAEGIRVAGINFNDTAAQANRYLDGSEDPFIGIGYDPSGRASINWGVTAPPETFIVDGDGTVLYKFTGPLVGSDLEQRFLPELNKALGRE